MGYVRIGDASQLPPPDEAREFAVGDKMICVANVNGKYSAMDNVCTHRGGPIGQGVVMGDKIVCPWHGWVWDPATGRTEDDPNAKIGTYALKIEGDDVYVEM